MEYSIKEKILLSIASVLKRDGKCSYSNLVKETFERYPSDFALTEYLNWPDSLKLDRPLRELRSDGLIQGNPQTFYILTNLGKNYASRLENRGKGLNKGVLKNTITRSPLTITLQKIKDSNDFKLFTQNRESYKSNNMKIRELTGHTLETPPETIVNMLKYIKEGIDTTKEEMLIQYLNYYINYYKKH